MTTVTLDQLNQMTPDDRNTQINIMRCLGMALPTNNPAEDEMRDIVYDVIHYARVTSLEYNVDRLTDEELTRLHTHLSQLGEPVSTDIKHNILTWSKKLEDPRYVVSRTVEEIKELNKVLAYYNNRDYTGDFICQLLRQKQ